MKKLNYLNVGCGRKVHKDWVNIDMISYSPDVKRVNLIKGIPFPDNSFDVVYHSQVLEHIPKEKAEGFIKECYRVLKPDGYIRIVVPDLENIVNEYKSLLDENLKNPIQLSEANYDWILLEMYDQTVRNHMGGLMAEYLQQAEIVNEKYILDRTGFVGKTIRKEYLYENTLASKIKKATSNMMYFRMAVHYIFGKIKGIFLSEKTKIGAFRLGGEIHMWMYDRYSLSRLLKKCGFNEVTVKDPFQSDIPNWADYELDVKDDMAYDPISLFVEARKSDST